MVVSDSASIRARSPGYIPQLEGLRGIAILSVLLHHFEVHIPKWADWGPIGVRLFFLMSGYLITISLWKLAAKAPTPSAWWKGLWDFHARRFVRLAPVLYLMLLGGLLLGLPEFTNDLAWHAAFLTNIHIAINDSWPGAASHLWSLSMQEQFYVIWPFLILVAPRRILPWILLGLFGFAMAYRAAIQGAGLSNFYWWVLLPGAIDSFALGALIAFWKTSSKPFAFVGGQWSLLITITAFAAYICSRLLRYSTLTGPPLAIIDTLENLFLGWLLLRTIEGWKGWFGKILENPVLIYLGKVSYGLYVFHVLVHVVVGPWLNQIGYTDYSFGRALILIAISVGVATLSWRFIETPLSSWVRKREQLQKIDPLAVASSPKAPSGS